MAFQLKGLIEDVEVSVRWDGHSYAPRSVMELYREYLKLHDGRFIGFMPDAGADHDHDKSAPAAYAAWMAVFDKVTEKSGEFPWEEHVEGEVY